MGAQPPRFTGLAREGWRSVNGLHHPASGDAPEPNHAGVPASLPQPRSCDAGSAVASLDRASAALSEGAAAFVGRGRCNGCALADGAAFSDAGAVSAIEAVRARAGPEQPRAQPSIINQPVAAPILGRRLSIVRFAIWFTMVATYFRHSRRAKVPKGILPRCRVYA